MADEFYAIEGSKFFIGPPLSQKQAAFVAADFSGLVYTLVDPWTTVGTSGPGARETTSTPVINRDVPVVTAGINNLSSYEAMFLWKQTDPGQQDIQDAFAGKLHQAFKIEHATGEIEYFIGIVTSAQRVGGGAGPGVPAKLQVTIAMGCKPVLVPAP